MSVVIRPAKPADVPALARIAVASYRKTFLPIIGWDGLEQRGIPYFEHRFSEECPHFQVAESEGGELLGFAEVRGGVLDMLFVHPEAVGSGIGLLLLDDAEQRGAIALECFARNAAARRFYLKHGWRECAQIRREFLGRTRAFVAFAKP